MIFPEEPTVRLGGREVLRCTEAEEDIVAGAPLQSKVDGWYTLHVRKTLANSFGDAGKVSEYRFNPPFTGDHTPHIGKLLLC